MVPRTDRRSDKRNQGFFLALRNDLTEAVRVRVRYDQPNEKGQTRRERNDDFGENSPTWIVPLSGRYLWNWFYELSNSLRRVRDGVCEPIPPSEFLAWKAATRNIVYPGEYDILRAMDAAFCAEMNQELRDFEERRKAKQEADIEAAKNKGGRRR